MSEIKYSPLCFLCRIEAGRDPAGVPKNDLCYSHMNREWHKEKTAKAEMLEALKDMMNKICDRCEGLDLQDCLDCPDEDFRQAIEAAEKEEWDEPSVINKICL